jgi:hypothetical protein
MKTKQLIYRSAKEMLAAISSPQYITFEESMTALRLTGDSTGNVWPKLSGNEIHVFANAAIHLYKTK